MATIIRVKRRRNEDPLESLLVSCKKARSEAKLSQNTLDQLNNELQYAGTVLGKDEVISKKIREAIKKDKLEKEYKRHPINVGLKTRNQEKQESVKNARFKIISSRRALDLEKLDLNDLGSKAEVSTADKTKEQTQKKDEFEPCLLCKQSNSGEPSNSVGSECKPCRCGKLVLEKKDNVEDQENEEVSETDNKIVHNVDRTLENDTGQSLSLSTGNVAPECSQGGSTGKVFQLYDIEIEGRSLPTFESLMEESQSAHGITCNSVPMVRETINRDHDYVYDLYYTNNRDLHLQLLENSLSLAMLDYHMPQLDDHVDDDGDDVYDDDDDENDESNWRNDYPDEDPRYFENEDVEYYYGDDVNEHDAFDEEDDGLSEWMSSRCHIEGDNDLSSPEEELQYDQIMDPFLRGASYDSFYKRVQKEMQEGEVTTNQDT